LSNDNYKIIHPNFLKEKFVELTYLNLFIYRTTKNCLELDRLTKMVYSISSI